jgi:Fe-S cluster assembly protein SufD
MIEVVKDAQEIDAYQKNDNLLLDRRARADTIPGLEILADEVRCTHGATAGPVDPEQIYYLMSRGLSRQWAERTVVEGFFEPVLQRIPTTDLRDRLTESVQKKLALTHKP